MQQTFRTTIIKGEEKNVTGIEIPAEIIEKMGAGKRPKVKVTLKGYTYRNTVAVYGGKYLVGVNTIDRAASGIVGGETLDVTIELDTEPRIIEVPKDLADALAKKPGATEIFDKLAPSKRKEFVRQVNDAKTQETRDRRIAGIVEKI